MDELMLILRIHLRSTRQTNDDVVYVTDDVSEHCAFIDIFQQERTLVTVTVITLKNLSQIIPHIKVFKCSRYVHSIMYTSALLVDFSIKVQFICLELQIQTYIRYTSTLTLSGMLIKKCILFTCFYKF